MTTTPNRRTKPYLYPVYPPEDKLEKAHQKEQMICFYGGPLHGRVESVKPYETLKTIHPVNQLEETAYRLVHWEFMGLSVHVVADFYLHESINRSTLNNTAILDFLNICIRYWK